MKPTPRTLAVSFWVLDSAVALEQTGKGEILQRAAVRSSLGVLPCFGLIFGGSKSLLALSTEASDFLVTASPIDYKYAVACCCDA